jgi:hypothetical protein
VDYGLDCSSHPNRVMTREDSDLTPLERISFSADTYPRPVRTRPAS